MKEQESDPVQEILDKYREIDEQTGNNHGWEVAIALLGQDRIDEYIEEHGIEPNTIQNTTV